MGRISVTTISAMKSTPSCLRFDGRLLSLERFKSTVHQTEQCLNDINELKNFAQGLIQVIAAYGVSPACAQIYLYKGVVNILDSTDASDEGTLVNIRKDAYSIEVKKVGIPTTVNRGHRIVPVHFQRQNRKKVAVQTVNWSP